jgi:VanZ family protein
VALIFFLSSRPRTRPPLEFPHVDKVIHVVEYGVLAWLLSVVLDPRARLRPVSLLSRVLLAALMVGALDELNQSRIPGRESSPWDLGADVVGASLAAILWLRVRRSGK